GVQGSFCAFRFLFLLNKCPCTYGSYDNDCDFDESCCWDGVCREKCSGCTFNYECGTDECCDSDGYCYDCSGYAAQPPPYYPPQQAGPYPPPQAQGMAQYPPPQAKGP
ncbi:unnamed protein product, partial [Porites lobata]